MIQIKTLFATVSLAFAMSLGFTSVAHAACVGAGPDAFYQPDQGEECDDGNQINGDGCENDCTVTPDWSCGLAIDFNALETEESPGGDTKASWGPGIYSREQLTNTDRPTFAYFGGDAFQGTYTLSVKVNQTTYNGENEVGDDDFIGFALGFNPGDANNENARYLLVDWKARDQSWNYGGSGPQTTKAGMMLSVVEGIPNHYLNFWAKSHEWATSDVKFLALAQGAHRNQYLDSSVKTYGTSGWENHGKAYVFEITYTESRLLVKVAGQAPYNESQQTVFDVTPSQFPTQFPDGKFPAGQIAFYGLSQAKVEYSLTSPLNSTCGRNVELVSPADGTLTDNPRPTISGTGDVGAAISVKVGSGPTAQTLTTTVANDGTWSVTPDTNVETGLNDIVVTSKDVRGAISTDTGSFEYIEHFVIITSPASPNTNFGGPSYSGTIPVTGTGVPGTTVEFWVDGTSTGVSTVVSTTGTWSANVPVSEGPHTIEAVSTNSLNTTDDDSVDVVVDVSTYVSITGPADGSSHGAPITTISGDGEAGATVVVTIDGQTATTTVAADGTWTVPAPGGPLTNDEFTATAVITDLANNTATATSTFNVHVDACAAGTDTCDVNATCTDTGAGGLYDCDCNAGYIGDGETCIQGPQVTITAPGDGAVVTVTTPTIRGTANPNTTVTVVIDGTETHTVTSDENGHWHVVPTAPLSEDTHTVEATVEIEGVTATDDTTFSVNTDVCGEELNTCEENSTCEDLGDGTAQCNCNEGYVKDAADLCALAPAVTILTPADQSVIRTTTPTLTGTANPNTVVTISIDGDIVGTTTSDNEGNWTFTVPDPSPLDEDGPYEFTASTTVGNTTATDEVTLALLNEPNVVIIESPEENDSVSTTPTVTGTSNPNAEITIVIRGEEMGTTTADENGRWTWTSTEELDLGPADIVAIDKDNDEEDVVNVTIDREQAPVVITGPADNSETEDSTPTVTGTGEPNTTVTIIVDGKEMGTVPVDENGDWTWTPDESLEPGPHTIVAKSDDGSEDQITLTITESDELIDDELIDDELMITGGKVFGCSSTSTEVPVGVIVLFGLGTIALARRRKDQAA